MLATSDSEPRSSFTIEGGFARVNPVPVVSHPARWKAFTTCLPSRPVAPVIRAVFAMMCWSLSGEGGSFEVADLRVGASPTITRRLYEINKLDASNHDVHIHHSSRSPSKIARLEAAQSEAGVQQFSFCVVAVVRCSKGLKILLHGNPEGLFAMKNKIYSLSRS